MGKIKKLEEYDQISVNGLIELARALERRCDQLERVKERLVSFRSRVLHTTKCHSITQIIDEWERLKRIEESWFSSKKTFHERLKKELDNLLENVRTW